MPSISTITRNAEVEIDGHTVKAGDEINVRNRPGKHNRFISGTWTFTAVASNRDGTQWFEAVGGTDARPKHHRAFSMERLSPILPKKARRRKTTGGASNEHA